MNWRYRSSAYDPDPALLTGSIPGYAELANLYSRYCVHAIYAEISIANQDTQSYIVVMWPGTSNLNVNSLSASDLAEYSGNVLAKSRILGTVNGISVTTMTSLASPLQLVGPRYKTDMDWSSSTSSNPLNEFYLNIGVYSPTANIAFPVVTKCRLVYDIEFFQLRQLES